MAHGFKSGGRVKGTPNKRTQDVVQRLQALGCDPIEGMARIAMDEANPVELRGRMYAELAGYLYPKRRAVEVRQDASPITFEIDLTEPRQVEEVALLPDGTATKETRRQTMFSVVE